MLLQISVCVLLLDRVMGHAHFNALDGLRYDRATVKMGEPAAAARPTFACCKQTPVFLLRLKPAVRSIYGT